MGDVEKNQAQDAGRDAGGKNRALGGQLLGAVLKREARNQDAHREAHAAKDAHTDQLAPRRPFGQRRETHLDQHGCHGNDAQRLAQHQAKEDALRHRVAQDRRRVHANHAQLSVGKGKQRQDDEVDRRGDRALDALQRRSHAVHDVLHALGRGGKAVLAQDMQLGVVGVVKLGAALAQPVLNAFKFDVRFHRQEEGENNAGKRGVDAGL